MKVIIIILALVSSISFAETKSEEKVIELETHPTRILFTSANEYEIELYGHSAKYHTTEEHLACLKNSMNKKKNALLKVTAYSLIIKECNAKQK